VRAFVGDIPQVIAFRKDVRDALKSSPFSHFQREEVLLALTEMGTNLVFHARGGTLEVTLPAPGMPLLRIGCWNSPRREGPSREGAGGTTRPAGGLGIGLSSLERLMDRVVVEALDGSFGVTCEKDVRVSAKIGAPCPSNR